MEQKDLGESRGNPILRENLCKGDTGESLDDYYGPKEESLTGSG